MNATNIDVTTKRMVRRMAGVEAHVTVAVVSGRQAPEQAGERGYYTTPSGKTVVNHPGAYGWRTVYHCSTLRVEVGADWLAGEGRHFDWRCEDGVEAVYDLRTFERVGTCSALMEWKRKHWLVVRGVGEERRTYHAKGKLTSQEAVVRAEEAWAPQDREAAARLVRDAADFDRRAAGVMDGMDPRAVPVTLAVSVRAGNCEAGSRALARRAGVDPHRGASAAVVIRAARSDAWSVRARSLRAVGLAARLCAVEIVI